MQSSIVLVATIAAIGTAQMTFSDGWEKRAAHRTAFNYPHQKVTRSGGVHIPQDNEVDALTTGERAEVPTAIPLIETDCEMEYMDELRYHHAAIRELEKKLIHCQSPWNNLIPSNSNSIVRNFENYPLKRANSFNPFALPSRF